MHDDETANLPTLAGDGEIVVSEEPEGLLVGGDPEAVESYIAHLHELAGQAVQVVGIDKSSVGNGTGLLAAANAVLRYSGKYVKLHPDSVNAIRQGNLIPGADGFFRMMTRGTDNKFLHQLQWKPAALGPDQLVSVQMLAVQLALKSAISGVEDAVHRVGNKVEEVLQLVQATSAGDVLGDSKTITRQLAYLEKYGSLPDAYWDAVSNLGPSLNRTVERLRDHVGRVLNSLDPDRSVQDRAEKLHAVVGDNLIGETLSLLVVAEESLYKWQRLRIARVEATEPDQLPHVLEHARELLTEQLAQDGKLYQLTHRVIDEFANANAIDGFRFRAVKQLAHDRDKLRQDLDSFARARRSQVESGEPLETPGIPDAVKAVRSLAKQNAGKALAAAGQGLVNVGDLLTAQSGEKEPVVRDQRTATESAE